MIILRQREYTSVRRKINAKVARLRTNVAQKLGDYIIDRGTRNNIVASDLINGGDDNIGRDKLKPIIKEIRDKHDSRVLDTYNIDGSGSFALTDTDRAKEVWNKQGISIKDFNRKTQNALNRHKKLVFADDTTNNASLAHELGHLQNSVENKKLSKKSQDPNNRAKLNSSLKTSGFFKKIDRGRHRGNYELGMKTLKDADLLDTGTGFREAFRRFRDSSAIVREERKASRRGVNFLKRLGSGKKELKASKDYLKKALGTYKTGRLISVLSPIQNKIQIDSRRRK